MVGAVDLRDRLYDLGKKLLSAPRPKTPPRRRRDSIREGQRDRIVRVSSIHSTGVSCGARVNHVVDRVERERNVIRHPEDSVAAANNSCWRQAVSYSDA